MAIVIGPGTLGRILVMYKYWIMLKQAIKLNRWPVLSWKEQDELDRQARLAKLGLKK